MSPAIIPIIVLMAILNALAVGLTVVAIRFTREVYRNPDCDRRERISTACLIPLCVLGTALCLGALAWTMFDILGWWVPFHFLAKGTT